jgi:ABC-type sulfate transport system permease subunit
MVEKTVLALPAGKKTAVPRALKRLVQIAIAVVGSSAVFLVMIVGNGVLLGRGAAFQSGWNTWTTFIKRPDILGTMIVTSVVTVLVIYWMRDRERK